MNKLLVLLAVAACTDHRAAITGTQSLQIDLVSPTSPGSIDVNDRLPDTARAVSMTITAMDADGNTDTTYNQKLQVYVYYLGTLTPYLGGSPLTTVQMVDGKGSMSATLPPVFGPTTLWFDDGSDADPTYATGVSPTLWFRDPFVSDIQTPLDEMAINALTDSPLENKNVSVDITRYGAKGHLIITSRYSSGYTLADVQCADTDPTKSCTPPCTSQDYDYIDVYSYSAPQDQDKRFLDEGQLVVGFAGGVSNFDGLIEIGFPQTFVNGLADVHIECEPQPAVADFTGDANDWFAHPINFKRHQSAVIEIDGAKVCDLDDDYDTFNEWKLDPSGVGGICSGKNIIDIVTAGTVDIDPSTLVGKTLPKLVGTLRPIMETGFNVWLVYPRTLADITTN